MAVSIRSMLIRVALLALLPAVAAAQEVEIRPKLVAGDEFRLAVTRVRQGTRPPTNVTRRTAVVVRVVAASADGFLVDWIPGDTEFDDPRVASNPILTAADRAVRGISFRLKLSVDGELEGLANEADVSPKLQAVATMVMDDLGATLPADQRKAFDAVVRQVMSPAVLISTATTDAQTYFALNGATLAAGEEVEAGVNQPSPIGGGAIPARISVRMESANADLASLTLTTTYDPDALRGLTVALAQQAGTTIPADELAKVSLDMRDEGKYSFDRSLGLMREVDMTRRVDSGSERRVDRWQIRLVTAPTR